MFAFGRKATEGLALSFSQSWHNTTAHKSQGGNHPASIFGVIHWQSAIAVDLHRPKRGRPSIAIATIPTKQKSSDPLWEGADMTC